MSTLQIIFLIAGVFAAMIGLFLVLFITVHSKIKDVDQATSIRAVACKECGRRVNFRIHRDVKFNLSDRFICAECDRKPK